MYIGRIEGGTNAGWRRVNATRSREDWVCPKCGKKHRYFWTSCPVDGTPRPETHVCSSGSCGPVYTN